MLVLLLCILCNVILAVIFKAFSKHGVDNLHAIIINYFTCVLMSSIILGESSIPLDLWDKPWWIYSLILASVFIVGFNIMALSFQKCGVALTVIIQKMSLVIPAAFAISLYNEPLGIAKAAGISCAIAAVVLVNLPSPNDPEKITWKHPLIFYPLMTFLLSGVIEIILFYVEAENLLQGDGIKFTATSFGQAGFLGLLYAIFRAFKTGKFFSRKDFIGGISLGIPNFMTIYLLVYLLGKGWQGSVLFPINSIGILLLTALVGILAYKEKAERSKMLGLGLGTLAIILISYSI